jgi:hypothetical protein
MMGFPVQPHQGYKFKMNEYAVNNPKYIKPINARHLHALIDSSYVDNRRAKANGKVTGYVLDEELSNQNHKVFRDKHDTTVVAFTGTQNLGDVGTDALLALGLQGYSTRFKESEQLITKVRDKYGNNPVLAVGHSLGGRLAEHVTDKNLVDKSITFNKGAGIGDIYKHIKPNQTDIHSNTDYVSFLSNTQRGGKHINNPGTIILDPLYSHGTNHLRKFNKSEKF